MMKKIFLILVVCTLIPSVVLGQISRAEKAMHHYKYSEAIFDLLDLLDKDTTIVEVKEKAVILLAECYRKQNNIAEAVKWYAKAVESGHATSETYLSYGQILKISGNYNLAKQVFLKYDILAPGHGGMSYAAFCDSAMIWKQQKAKYWIKNLTAVNSEESDFSPVIYEDGMIFTSDRSLPQTGSKIYGWTGNGYLRLLRCFPVNPDDLSDGYKSPEPESGIFNQEYHDGPATFSRDYNEVYFNRTIVRQDKGKKEDDIRTHLLKIFHSSKKNGKWEIAHPFFLNSDDYSVGHPSLSPDSKILFLVSDMKDGYGGTDIYMCRWENDQWGPPVNLGPSINTPGNEMFPYMADDGRLYFSSDGLPGLGGLDIFFSSWKEGIWSKPANMGVDVNSSYDDFGITMTKDDDEGLFSSNRPGGSGSDDLYYFDRNKEIPDTTVVPAYVSGCVRDKNTRIPLPGATVFLLDRKSEKVLILKANSEGCFRTPVIKGNDYLVKAMESGYISDCLKFAFGRSEPGNDLSIPRDLLLDKLSLERKFTVENIYYDFDKYFVRTDAQPALDNLVRIMKENPLINAELGSHTDSRGSDEYNRILSQNRAQAAVDYLIKNGVEFSRISAHGYGESQLVNRCSNGIKCSAAEHQANRRTEFRVTSFNLEKKPDDFDLIKFREGDILDLHVLPAGFFNNCSGAGSPDNDGRIISR